MSSKQRLPVSGAAGEKIGAIYPGKPCCFVSQGQPCKWILIWCSRSLNGVFIIAGGQRYWFMNYVYQKTLSVSTWSCPIPAKQLNGMNEKCLSILVLITHCKMAISCGSNLLKDRSNWSSAGEKSNVGGVGRGGERSKCCRRGEKRRLSFLVLSKLATALESAFWRALCHLKSWSTLFSI